MKTFIAVPCFDKIDVLSVQSIYGIRGETSVNFLTSSLVYDSRNKLSEASINSGSDYTLWLDSDMVFPSDMLERMLEDMEKGECDIVTGLGFQRKPPYNPCIFKKLRINLEGVPDSDIYRNFPEGLFEVEGCGMGACLMKTEVLKKCIERFHTCFQPLNSVGEDLSFCIRARELGYKIMCDSNIEVGHIGQVIIDKKTYNYLKGR